MKSKDLTGQRFGKLTVVSNAGFVIEPSGRKKILWKCLCDCGNETVVRSDNLLSGHTRSCGCLCGRIDIIGNVYGRLKILEYVGNSEYLCECQCGNKTVVKANNLKNGNTKSCGCLQREIASEINFKDLVGNRYGKLVVVERVNNDRYGHVNYKCKCDCGGECIVDAQRLRGGITSSCGCIKSKGEMIINNWLSSHNVNYVSQYSHENIFYLDTKRRPIFDFAIFDRENNLKCLIEYNGELHYGYSGYGWNNKDRYTYTINRDNEKRKICEKLKIKLCEIPYWELDNIDRVLEGLIKDEATEPDMEEAQENESN